MNQEILNLSSFSFFIPFTYEENAVSGTPIREIINNMPLGIMMMGVDSNLFKNRASLVMCELSEIF